MYPYYCLPLPHSPLLSSIFIKVNLFPLQIVFIERLALHAFMAYGYDAKGLQLQRYIKYIMYIFVRRYSGHRKTFTKLHPATTQSHIFCLKL